MRHHQIITAILTGILAASAVNAADLPGTKRAADNTARNAVDRDMNSTTPIDQSNDKSAIETTAAIRRAVVADKSLSTSAHNVKIVTDGNTVTLRGAVASTAEKIKVESLAVRLATGKKVRNELSVAE